jgi:hypothetical protein
MFNKHTPNVIILATYPALNQPTVSQDWDQNTMLMVYIRIKVQVDLQVDKSSVVVKEPFFPQV